MSNDLLIHPHGGTLVNRVADGSARDAARASVERMAHVRMSAVQYSDVFCIATGVFSPLTGFVGKADYESIVERMRLANGTVWSLPITLAVSSDVARSTGAGSVVALEAPGGD